MRHGDTQRSRYGDARRDPAHHLDGDARRREGRGFLATAAEDVWIAAFQPPDGRAALREPHHQPADERLQRRPATATLPDLDHTHARAAQLEDIAVHEVVDQHDVAAGERACRLERQELRISGPRPDQIHHAAVHQWPRGCGADRGGSVRGRGGAGGTEDAAPIEQAFRRRRNRKGIIAAHHRHSSRCSSACDRGARPVARTARTSVGGGTIRWFRVRTVVLPNANRSSGCARRRSSTSSRVP